MFTHKMLEGETPFLCIACPKQYKVCKGMQSLHRALSTKLTAMLAHFDAKLGGVTSGRTVAGRRSTLVITDIRPQSLRYSIERLPPGNGHEQIADLQEFATTIGSSIVAEVSLCPLWRGGWIIHIIAVPFSPDAACQSKAPSIWLVPSHCGSCWPEHGACHCSY